MREEEFFNLRDYQQEGRDCIPFSYGAAIYHATRIEPKKIVCIYHALEYCDYFDDNISGYQSIVNMHNGDMHGFCDRIVEFIRQNCPNFANEMRQVIERYIIAKQELSLEHRPIGNMDRADFLSECENKLRAPNCKTAMLCINCDDVGRNEAHSVALTYNNADPQNFIMKDPNFLNCESNVDLNALIVSSAACCRYINYHVGDALFFSEM